MRSRSPSPEPEISENITEIEFDEMWHFIKKDAKLWVIKAFDRCSRRTIGWVLGHRDATTFRRLYGKVQHLKNAVFYADDWNVFSKVLPSSERHIIGKSGTVMSERDNGNTRHHLGRFTRRTKVVSKSPTMVDLTLRLWNALTIPDVFKQYQQKFMAISR